MSGNVVGATEVAVEVDVVVVVDVEVLVALREASRRQIEC